MTGTKRSLTVLALVVAVLGGGVVHAWATLSDSAAVSTGIGTMRIQKPESISGSLSCRPATSTLSLTWKPSTTPRVIGSRITIHYIGGPTQPLDVPVTATSADVQISTADARRWKFDVTVTAVTDYGWTGESSRQGQFGC